MCNRFRSTSELKSCMHPCKNLKVVSWCIPANCLGLHEELQNLLFAELFTDVLFDVCHDVCVFWGGGLPFLPSPLVEPVWPHRCPRVGSLPVGEAHGAG